jgi:penicillin amidase
MRPMPTRPGLRPLLRLLGRRRPAARGVLRVPGLRAQLTIGRDRWGIPHVEAASDEDAWFGLGFCHGQDRGFQLELLLRAGRGTISEMAGPATLPIDRLSRTLGFHRIATAQVGRLDEGVRAQVDAYVAGINAAAASTPNPHELALLRRRRTSWTSEDVLAFAGLQALALGGNWDTELARLQILLADGPDALAALDTTYAPWLPVVTPVGAAAGAALGRLASDVTRLRDAVGGAGASNAWAVSGARSGTGAPLLANDPHLAPGVPAPWYLAHVVTPEWSVAGASFVGSPTFPSGHNGRAAWGITAACTDSADLFWEELDLTASTARGADGPEPIDRRSERIEIRGREPEEFEVVVTARGPVVTGVLDGVTTALSLRATWLEPVPVRGLLAVHRVGDFATFRELFVDWPGPSLNVVYADAAGHIGGSSSARSPSGAVRRAPSRSRHGIQPPNGSRRTSRPPTCPTASTRRRASWHRPTTPLARTIPTRRSSASTGSTGTVRRASASRWWRAPTGRSARSPACRPM